MKAGSLPPLAPDEIPDGRRVRAALLNKVCGDEDMFALGSSVARVVQMASSADEGTHALAYYVLSDVALTQRILRLANTVKYRTANGTAVTLRHAPSGVAVTVQDMFEGVHQLARGKVGHAPD